MYTTRFKLIAELVEFPPMGLLDIMLDFNDLIRRKPSLTQRLEQVEICWDTAMDLCTLIVDFFFREMEKRINPIVSEWEEKATSIYLHLRPEQCFFGVDERRILKDTFNILPKFLNCIFTNNYRKIDCGSIQELSWLMGEHLISMMAEHLAMRLPNTTNEKPIHFRRGYCLLQRFEKMMALISTSASCVHSGGCQCGVALNQDKNTDRCLDDRGRHAMYMSIINDGFSVDYHTSNRAVMEILIKSANTDIEEISDSPHVPYSSKKCEQSDGHRDKAPDNLKTQVLFSLILTGLVNETMEKAQVRLCPADFERIVQNLTKKAKQQIKLSTVGPIKANDVEIYKVLFKDLHEKIGSELDLLTAMESQVIDDIIIEALRIRLNNPPTQESAFARFFSSVGQLIRKPFSAGFGRGPISEPLFV